MKIKKMPMAILIFTSISKALALAPNVQIAVNSYTKDKFNLICQLSKTVVFVEAPGVKKLAFRIQSYGSLPIVLRTVANQNRNVPYDVFCYRSDKANTDWFKYKLIEPYDESAQTSGQFHYDPSYQGAFTYDPVTK